MLGLVIVVFGVAAFAGAASFASNHLRRKGQQSAAAVRGLNEVIGEAWRLWAEGHKDDAAALLEGFVAGNADAPDGDVILIGHYTLGAFYAELGKKNDAAPLLARSLTYYETARQLPVTWRLHAACAYAHLAIYHSERGDDDAAQFHFRRAAQWAERGKSRGTAAMYRGFSAANRGEYLLAADQFAAALAHPPEDTTAINRNALYLNQASMLWQIGFYTAALEAAHQAIGTDATEPAAGVYRLLALASISLERFEAAEAALAAAMEREDSAHDTSELLDVRCRLRISQGRYAEVIALAQAHMAGAETPSAMIYFHLGDALREIGCYDEADAALRSALGCLQHSTQAQHRASAAAYMGTIALIRIEQDKCEGAIELLELVAAEPKATPAARRLVPAVRLHAEARSGLRAPDAVRKEAQAYLEVLLGEVRTFPVFTDALRHYTEPFFHLAESLFHVGDTAGASALLERFAERDVLSPGDLSRWHYWRGRCCEERGDLPAARAEYEAAANAPIDPRARYVRLARERLAGEEV